MRTYYVCRCGYKWRPGDVRYKAAGTAARLRTVILCPSCSSHVTPTKTEVSEELDGPSHRERSAKQERAAADRYGARVVGGSGSTPLSKGDFQKRGLMRGECKFTDKKSYSLKLEDLKKLENEVRGDEGPVFEIQFSSDIQ